MPSLYDPFAIRDSLRRAGVGSKNAAGNNSVGSNSAASSSIDEENKRKWYDFVKGIDKRLARAEYDKISNDYRSEQKKAGLDPERDLELLERNPTFIGSARSGIEDAALNLAEMGATIASKIPSPAKKDAETVRQIVSYRRQLLKDYINAKGGINPGKGISAAGEIILGFLNPAGKLKVANALYHSALPVARSEPASRAPVAAASNIAGESIESALGPILRKIPFLGKVDGLLGNVFGQAIDNAANRLEQRVADLKREKKK